MKLIVVFFITCFYSVTVKPKVTTTSTSYHDPFNPQVQDVQPTLSDISNKVLSIYNNCSVNENNSFSPNRPQLLYNGGVDGVMSPLTCDSGSSDGANETKQVNNQNQAPNGINPTKLDLRVDTSETALTNTNCQLDEVTKGMKMLVNLDDINSPVEGDFRLTMDDATAHIKNKPISKRSPKVEYIGPKPTLSEMKSSRPSSTTSSVMRQSTYEQTSVGDQSGALVVYGSQNGAPPLQRAVGFGLGSQIQNGGYGGSHNEQQYAY